MDASTPDNGIPRHSTQQRDEAAMSIEIGTTLCLGLMSLGTVILAVATVLTSFCAGSPLVAELESVILSADRRTSQPGSRLVSTAV
jgi:hypothetical protein